MGDRTKTANLGRAGFLEEVTFPLRCVWAQHEFTLELGWGQGHDKASEGQAQPGSLSPPEEGGAAPCIPLTPAAMKGNLKSYQEGSPKFWVPGPWDSLDFIFFM